MLSMGLLVAPQPEAVGLCPKLPDTSPLAVQLWKGNIDVCGWPIWNHPTLELIAENEYSGVHARIWNLPTIYWNGMRGEGL